MARTKAGFFFVKTRSGKQPAMDWVPLVGATAYYEGQVLRASATTGSAAKQSAAGTTILGIAAANVSSGSAATTKMPIYIADSENVFEGKMIASKAPRAVMYSEVDIRVGTTHNHRLQGTASTKVARIVGFHPDEVLTAHTGCRFWVTFGPKSLSGGADKIPAG